jgi:hypothetical protein
MPRGARTIGVCVEKLERLMHQHPGENDFCDRMEWLQP